MLSCSDCDVDLKTAAQQILWPFVCPQERLTGFKAIECIHIMKFSFSLLKLIV